MIETTQQGGYMRGQRWSAGYPRVPCARSCLRLDGAVTCVRHLGLVLDSKILNKYTINVKSKVIFSFSMFELSKLDLLDTFLEVVDAIPRRRNNGKPTHEVATLDLFTFLIWSVLIYVTSE